MQSDITDDFVKRVRERADVPRVRSSEVKKIIEAMVALGVLPPVRAAAS